MSEPKDPGMEDAPPPSSTRPLPVPTHEEWRRWYIELRVAVADMMRLCRPRPSARG